MKYKVIITNNQEEINGFLNQGWVVDSVTAQRVSTSGQGYTSMRGHFCIVLKK